MTVYCTMQSTGFFCIRFPESMLERETKQLYNDWLTKDFGPLKKIEVCTNSTLIAETLS